MWGGNSVGRGIKTFVERAWRSLLFSSKRVDMTLPWRSLLQDEERSSSRRMKKSSLSPFTSLGRMMFVIYTVSLYRIENHYYRSKRKEISTMSALAFVEEIVGLLSHHSSILSKRKDIHMGSNLPSGKDMKIEMNTFYTFLNQIMNTSKKYGVTAHENLQMNIDRVGKILSKYGISYEQKELPTVRVKETSKEDMKAIEEVVNAGISKISKYSYSGAEDKWVLVFMYQYVDDVLEKIGGILKKFTSEQDPEGRYESMYKNVTSNADILHFAFQLIWRSVWKDLDDAVQK